ncbi:hypothetical protein EV715DRAFT_165085, partial [Schizophyllum commune]
RCFPHVINIAVKTGVSTHHDFEYARILSNDPIGKVRTLSNWFRTSGQRRDILKAVILRGNAILRSKRAQAASSPPPPEFLALVILLRDVDTRWSSMYLMILRLLELYPAVNYVLHDPKHARDRHLLLQRKELAVLKDITTFLKLFHKTQELLSANRTPTLAYAIPAYELLLEGLDAMKQGFPGLRHAIIASERKLIEYLSLCRRSRLYSLAMG